MQCRPDPATRDLLSAEAYTQTRAQEQAPVCKRTSELIGELFLRYEYHVASAQLIFAMLGMGVALRPDAFMEVVRFPKGFILGLGSVLILSPALALVVARAFDLDPGLATGLILVAAVPGGTMSNILTYFAKANVPLSIALTAVATTGCLLTTPLVLQFFAGSAIGGPVEMPGTRIALEIGFFLLLPLGLGMLIGRLRDSQRDEIAKTFIRISIFFIALLVIGSSAAERIDPTLYPPKVLIGIALFPFVLIIAGFGLLRVFGLPAADAVAAGIETSFRNVSLALLVKASVWPAKANVVDPFADQVFFTALFYSGFAFLAAAPAIIYHRHIASD